MSSAKPFTVLLEPTIKEATTVVKKAIVQHQTLIVVGKFSVRYAGRAKSKLEPGERILIIKKDGSLLVHRPVGYEPVNWQPPGCIFHVQTKDNVLEIRALRRQPRETIHVFFDEIHLLSAFKLVDAGDFYLYASERDMQKAILLEPSLVEKGFKPVSFEKYVDAGFVDVYGTDKDGNLVVVEIKRKTAGKEAAIQLAKYIEKIKRRTDREIRGILVAPRIAKGVGKLLAVLGLELRRLNPKKCSEILQRLKTKKLEEFLNWNST